MHTCMTYIYIYIYIMISLSLSIYTYMLYIYIYYICYIYICIYIDREIHTYIYYTYVPAWRRHSAPPNTNVLHHDPTGHTGVRTITHIPFAHELAKGSVKGCAWSLREANDKLYALGRAASAPARPGGRRRAPRAATPVGRAPVNLRTKIPDFRGYC